MFISVATALLSGSAPAQAAYSNEAIWEETVGAQNKIADCVEVGKIVTLSETDAQVGFKRVRSVGSDEAVNYFMGLWREAPEIEEQAIIDKVAYIQQYEEYGYDMSGSRKCLQNMQVYSLPNLVNAVPVAERVAFQFYANIEVSGDQVTVTPKFDRVTVMSAELQNGSPVATIQVVNQTTGLINTYTYEKPATEPPGQSVPPASNRAFTKTYTPTISGTAKVGKTLTAKVKAWSPKASFEYQWYANDEIIAGATKSTYKLTAAELGTAITVAVIGSKSGYAAVSRASKSTVTVKAGSLARGKVSVSGTRKVGRVLTAKTSKWSSGVEYHYQWYRNSAKIADATARTYTSTVSDRGKRIKVKVWTSKDGYNNSASRTSSRTGKIAAGTLAVSTPEITGAATVGSVLTASTGVWEPAGVTFVYQWYRSGKAIKGATGSAYLLVGADQGKQISVKVTGSLTGYASASRTSVRTPKVGAPELEAQAVAVAEDHTCALTTTGAVWCWGVNWHGELGIGSTKVDETSTPQSVEGLTDGVEAIVAGRAHTCALTDAGAVWCWGSNGSGQLGDGTTKNRSIPVKVEGLTSGVVAITAGGGDHTCALTSAGTVKCWGSNGEGSGVFAYGQLGDGTTTERHSPVDVKNLPGPVVSVSAGYRHTCAVSEGGSVYCWGSTYGGGLEIANRGNYPSPTQVEGLTSGYSQVWAGDDHTCALRDGEKLMCWGLELHRGVAGEDWFPEFPSSLGSLIEVTDNVAEASVDAGICVVTAAGDLKCWHSGRPMDVSSSPEPDLIGGFSSVSNGWNHTCAVKSSGAIKCWGSNLTGQLGNVTPGESSPTLVSVKYFD